MVLRVQVVDGEYRVVLPPEAVEALKLTEGLEVKVVPVRIGSDKPRYISKEEAEESYLRTEPLHHETYTELAK